MRTNTRAVDVNSSANESRPGVTNAALVSRRFHVAPAERDDLPLFEDTASNTSVEQDSARKPSNGGGV